MADKDLETLLTAAVRRRFGDGASICKLRRLSSGASCESWSFRVKSEEQSDGEHLILRLPPPGSDGDDIDRRLAPGRPYEADILALMPGQDVPAPSVRFVLDKDDGLGSGYAMEFRAGETMPQKIFKDPAFAQARNVLPGQLVAARHGLNEVSREHVGFLPVESAEDQIALFRDVVDDMGIAHSGIEYGISWLKDHLPPAGPVRLVHGDFRMSNFLVTEEGLNAVIDWELAHLGDPVEDLAWLCVRSWRFTRPGRPAGGLASRAHLLDLYAEATGDTVDPNHLRFWEVLGNVKWAVICLLQCRRFQSGRDRSIELAAIGRRVEEPIYDMIRLLEGRDGGDA